MPNKYRTPYSRLIGALKNSATKKRNAGWGRASGAGFVAEDIEDIQYRTDGLRFKFSWDSQTIQIHDLNLRETEEALKWAEQEEENYLKRVGQYNSYMRGKKRKLTEGEIQGHLAPRMR